MRQSKAEEVVRSDPVVGPITIETFAAGGPGGQRQNTSNTAVRLRIEIQKTDEEPVVLDRLRTLFPSQVNSTGELLVESREADNQKDNRRLAFEKVEAMLVQTRRVPKKRKPRSKKLPSGVKKQRESDAQKRRRVKQYRRKPGRND